MADTILGISKQLSELMNTSEQGIYVYLDDKEKVCNEKFASMLNYSAKEWADANGNFPEVFVMENSRSMLIHTYQRAMENGEASTIQVEWKKKGKGSVKTEVILVPIEYNGQRMALHFVTAV